MARTRRTRSSPPPRTRPLAKLKRASPPAATAAPTPKKKPARVTPDAGSTPTRRRLRSQDTEERIDVVSVAALPQGTSKIPPEIAEEEEEEAENSPVDLNRAVGAAIVTERRSTRSTRSLSRSFEQEGKSSSRSSSSTSRRETLNEVKAPEELKVPKAPEALEKPEEPKTPKELEKPEEPKTPKESEKPEEPKTPEAPEADEPSTVTSISDNYQRAEERWLQRYEELKAYQKTHGDTLVSSRDSGKLRTWVCEQRKQYKRWRASRKSAMTVQRAKLLDRIDFDWEPLSSGASSLKNRERFDKMWYLMLDELIDYKDEFGDCLVPGNYKDNPRLGDWVHRQRKELRAMNRNERSGMTPERKKKLDEIGFDWEPMKSLASHIKRRNINKSKFQDMWDERLNELQEFMETYGKRPVPTGEDYRRLSNWIHLQRKEYKKYKEGEKSSMTEDRVKRLEDLGFDWAPMSTQSHNKYRDVQRFQDIWNERYQELVEYHEEHGDCLVLRSDPNQRLASWVHVQRKEYKRKHENRPCGITEYRISKLNELGFDWAPSQSGALKKRKIINEKFEELWLKHFNELKRYKRKHGHTVVRQGRADYAKLAGWVRVQRKEGRKFREGRHSTLTEERVEKLNEIDFEWSPLSQENKDEAWNERYEEFAEFRANYGGAIVEKGTSLNRWLRIQRQEYRKWKGGMPSSMTEERAQKIEELGFDWDPTGGFSKSTRHFDNNDSYAFVPQQSWEAWFAELESYRDANGDCDVPADFENRPLLAWVDSQRRELKKKEDGLRSSLTDERKQKLDDLGFDWTATSVMPVRTMPARPAKRRRLIENYGASDEDEDEDWEMRFAELKSYKAEKGDCLVPEDWDENPILASWVAEQRTEHKKWMDDVDSSMDKERATRLNEIGFDWKEEEMDLKISAGKKQTKSKGKDKMPTKSKDESKKQTKSKDEGKKPTKSRVEDKSNIYDSSSDYYTESEDDDASSVESEASKDDIEWNARLAELKSYKSTHGDCLVPENHKNEQLAAFVEKQRAEHKKWKEGLRSSMTKKKASKLSALKFEWVQPASASIVKGRMDPEQHWELRWKELKQYKEVYGDCLVPKNFKANRALGAWVARQRTQYWRMKEKKPTTITKAQVRKLKQLQFAFIVPYLR